MSKKSNAKKRMLVKAKKKSRRIPVLVVVRTHKKISSNKLGRSWRSRKLRIQQK